MNDFWKKSVSSAQAARMLLAAGNTDGAVNRAYYAMFDAAKAALEGVSPELAAVKSHSSIIRNFSKFVVVENKLDTSLGRSLTAAEQVRYSADYERQPVELNEARRILEDMERFLVAVGELLGEQP